MPGVEEATRARSAKRLSHDTSRVFAGPLVGVVRLYSDTVHPLVPICFALVPACFALVYPPPTTSTHTRARPQELERVGDANHCTAEDRAVRNCNELQRRAKGIAGGSRIHM